MSFEVAVIIVMILDPLLTGLLVFGLPRCIQKKKERNDRHRSAQFRSSKRKNHFKYRKW